MSGERERERGSIIRYGKSISERGGEEDGEEEEERDSTSTILRPRSNFCDFELSNRVFL